MEICILILLYCLSQKEDFAESVKPLLCKLKDSEQMLCFLKDLSKFTETFSTFRGEHPCERPCPPPREEPHKKEDKKTPQPPTAGIADEFIQSILENYFQKR